MEFIAPGRKVGRRYRVEPLVAVVRGKVLDRYAVDQANVFIVDEGGAGYYLVQEPPLSPKEVEIYDKLMENLHYSLRPAPRIGDPMKYIEGFIWDAAQDLGVVDEVHRRERFSGGATLSLHPVTLPHPFTR